MRISYVHPPARAASTPRPRSSAERRGRTSIPACPTAYARLREAPATRPPPHAGRQLVAAAADAGPTARQDRSCT